MWDRLMAVNAKAVFFASWAAARRMPDGGRIVNLSILGTVQATPGSAV
ncbi:SDR family oxidoreductase [Nonomuraea turcica]|nr:SDR family oxidoreductase [Nonomuraea sp. G32]MDP4502648.1 SDR family oxidoreductase [Nonomuraea sp. G32]